MENTKATKVDLVTLAGTKVFLAPGQQLKLGQLWQQQTVVFIFLRHFACIACRAHATQVWSEREKYERNGAKLIFIGNGQPHFIDKFKEDLKLTSAVVLTDPSLISFQAAGFQRGFFKLVQPKSLINAAKLVANGHSQGTSSKETGSHWQMGGVLVINPQSQVLYHFISEALGDFPDENLDIITKDERSRGI